MTEESNPKSRGRPKRTWVKIDCHGILSGSINWQYTLDEQAIWVKLIAYSAICGGPPGIICDNDERPIPLWYVADELHCPKELLESVVEKGVEEGRIQENGKGLAITNFNTYQFTEYDRQKPYRQAKKAADDKDRYTKEKNVARVATTRKQVEERREIGRRKKAFRNEEDCDTT